MAIDVLNSPPHIIKRILEHYRCKESCETWRHPVGRRPTATHHRTIGATHSKGCPDISVYSFEKYGPIERLRDTAIHTPIFKGCSGSRTICEFFELYTLIVWELTYSYKKWNQASLEKKFKSERSFCIVLCLLNHIQYKILLLKSAFTWK